LFVHESRFEQLRKIRTVKTFRTGEAYRDNLFFLSSRKAKNLTWDIKTKRGGIRLGGVEERTEYQMLDHVFT